MSNSQASSSRAIEQTRSINKNATFLGLPREIRNMIYHYIFPKSSTLTGVLPPKNLNGPLAGKTDSTSIVQVIMYKKHDPPPYLPSSYGARHELAALMINRQVRDEILPVFYNNYHFTFYGDRRNLSKAMSSLKNLQAEHLSRVRQVSVYMKEYSAISPVPWLTVEEECLAKHARNMQVRLIFRYKFDLKWWAFAYEKCAERRSAGKSWDRIKAEFHRIEDEWEDRLDAGEESDSDYDSGSDGDGDDGGSNSDDYDDIDDVDDDGYDTDMDGLDDDSGTGE